MTEYQFSLFALSPAEFFDECRLVIHASRCCRREPEAPCHRRREDCWAVACDRGLRGVFLRALARVKADRFAGGQAERETVLDREVAA